MNSADLLEKLDMIKEAVERNPDKWWRELEFETQRSGDMFTCDSPNDVWRAFHYGQTVRLKPQREENIMTKQIELGEEQVELMVDRFLMWKIPASVRPDGGISFAPPENLAAWPVGTNFLDAQEARQMVEFMIGKPQRVKVEGEVDRSAVAAGRNFMESPVTCELGDEARVALAALLDCVKEEGDGN